MDKDLIKAFLKDIIIKEGLTPNQSSKVMSKYDSIYKGMLKGDKKKLMKYTDPKFKRPNPDAMAMGRAINLVKKDSDIESVNEARTDLEREYSQYDSFTVNNRHYIIKDIEEYPGNRVQIITQPGREIDPLTGDYEKSKIFFSDKILKMGGEFYEKERKKRTTPAWNKGQKSTTQRQYEKILKGAMRDAGGEGNEEFTYDMATSMIYDPEISSYLNKEYPRLGRNGKIERLQYDLEMYLQESVAENEYLQEKKLTKAEKDKKEDIIMSMKKKKGGKDKLTDKDYAIATSTAKKVAESSKEKSEKNYKSYYKNKDKNRLTELIKSSLMGPVNEKKKDHDGDGDIDSDDYMIARDKAIKKTKTTLKEYTDDNFSGAKLISKVNKPDIFGQQVFDELFPLGAKSEIAAIRTLKNYDLIRFPSPMFVHVSATYFEDEAGEKYKIHQTQFYNSNFQDVRNPKVTSLALTKLADPNNPSPQSQEDIRMGTMLVKTEEYIKDLKNLNILKTISESVLAERILKKLREGKEERTSTVSKSRAKSEVKQIEKGKRSDGMGKPTAKVYAVKDGKEIELKTLKDFNKHSSGYTYKLK